MKSFGKDGAKDFSNDPAAHDEAMRKIDGAVETINGDSATVNVDAKAAGRAGEYEEGGWQVGGADVGSGEEY